MARARTTPRTAIRSRPRSVYVHREMREDITHVLQKGVIVIRLQSKESSAAHAVAFVGLFLFYRGCGPSMHLGRALNSCHGSSPEGPRHEIA